MKQKVHSVSYLAKAEFEFKNGVYDLVALPTGAEVVKVSLEIVGTPTAGTISVGFKDETNKNYFLNLEYNIIEEKIATSAKDYTATSNKVVVAEVKNASNNNDVKGVLRVLYFLPSVIEVEY
ncbi:hypothetical protein [Helicobacter pylori]|uniref:hypothetical protein n=1 Tax=Helicobacter pylori TaxID=210 RepID=UPI001ABAD5B9|nr:hypothetical protein [Helicobacter pylori]